MSQRPPCPLCNGEGLIPHGVVVQRMDGPPPGAFTTPQGIHSIQLEFENDPKSQRPPIGLKPRKFWVHDRMQEFARYFHELVVTQGRFPSVEHAEEFVDLVTELNHD